MESKEVVRERVRRFRANKKKGESLAPEVRVEYALPHQATPIIISRLEKLEKSFEEFEERLSALENPPSGFLRGNRDSAPVAKDKDLYTRVVAEKVSRLMGGR